MPFDPDQFLNETNEGAAPFDPDSFLNETSGPKNIPVNESREADLGVLNRAQYSIEPLESNRKAFLTQQFGVENVKEDPDGETYIKQAGEWRPVNKDGLSVADFADFAGATPEMVGAGAGALAGLGPGSIPGAMVGAGAGSAARQGFSALLGTPQVASPIERVSEIGLSTAMGGVGAAGGKVLKAGGKKAIKTVRKAFPKLDISKDGLKLLDIAKKEGLPKPTPGQLAGGDDLILEKALGHRRFFGRNVKKQTDAQVKEIKKNLAKSFGEFVDTDSSRADIGLSVKNRAESYLGEIKKKSSDLFKEVAEESSTVGIDAGEFKDNLLKQFQHLGVFDTNGNPLKHSSRTGMTKDAFEKTQGIFKTLLDDIGKSGTDLVDGVVVNGQPGQYLDAKTINTMRQFIDKNIKESGYGFDDVLLMKLKNHFMDVNESMLDSKNPALKEKFKLARNLWAKQLNLNNQFKKGGNKGLGIADINDADVLRKVFSGKNQVKMLKEMTDDKTAEKAGVSFINDLLSKKVGMVDQKGARGAITAVRAKREAIIEAVGKAKYDKLMNNLHYLDRTGSSINPSQTSIVKMMSDFSPTNIVSGAVDAGAYKARSASKNFIKSMENFNKKIPNRVKRAAIGLSDDGQREASYLTRGPNRTPQNEKKEK